MITSKFPVLRPRLINHLLKRWRSSDHHEEHVNLARPIIVTITNATSRVSQTLALLLKQSPYVDELRLFDYKEGACGIAVDLSHIDTNTKVKAYTGLHMLRCAVEGTKIVVLCGGDATKVSHPENELFANNADYVRNIALHVAEFNPEAILCIATPPITAMVPLASEEYKRAEVYDSRRIVGVMSLGVMRANTIIGAHAKEDPGTILCPVIGGMSDKTTVAVVSQTKIGAKLPSPIGNVLRNKVVSAENDVLNYKYVENAGPCVVSTAFATARFVTSLIRGVLDIFHGAECAFVRQTGEAGRFLPYMGSIVKLGKYGIQSVHMPKLDTFECIQLQRAAMAIQEQIQWGEGYVTGESAKKKRCERTAPSCSVIKLKPVAHIGDAAFDPNAKRSKQDGLLAPKFP